MQELDMALVYRGDPPTMVELAFDVTVTTDPLRVTAPWLPTPVDVPDDTSLFDHATAEVYDLAAILRDLAADPTQRLALAGYVCD